MDASVQTKQEQLAILRVLAAKGGYLSIRDVAQSLCAHEFSVRPRLQRLERLSAVKSQRMPSMRYAEPDSIGREVVSTQYIITQHGRDLLAGGNSAGKLPTPAVNSVFHLGAAPGRADA